MAAPLFQAHSQIVCRVFSRKSPAFRVKRGTNRTEIVTRKNITTQNVVSLSQISRRPDQKHNHRRNPQGRSKICATCAHSTGSTGLAGSSFWRLVFACQAVVPCPEIILRLLYWFILSLLFEIPYWKPDTPVSFCVFYPSFCSDPSTYYSVVISWSNQAFVRDFCPSLTSSE
jgi:hypothetical protein